MVTDEWFRNSRWGPEDQRAFFDRLSRSRSSFARSQHARIKAAHLHGTGKKKLILEAIKLLQRTVREWPDEGDLAPCYWELAECENSLGNVETAIDHCRMCFRQEKRHPGMKTEAWKGFLSLIMKRDLKEYADEYLKVLKSRRDDLLFPDDHFFFHAAQSLIAQDREEHEGARHHAQKALESAGEEDSGFRFHPKVGLVKGQEDIIRRLRKIAR